MLEATSSSELVHWFVFVRDEDERERVETARAIGMALGGEE